MVYTRVFAERGQRLLKVRDAYLKAVGYILDGALGERQVGQVDLLEAFALQFWGRANLVCVKRKLSVKSDYVNNGCKSNGVRVMLLESPHPLTVKWHVVPLSKRSVYPPKVVISTA